MKIIKSGRKEAPYRVECSRCECVFMVTKSDMKFQSDQRDGDAYSVACPECGHDNWVAADLTGWRP